MPSPKMPRPKMPRPMRAISTVMFFISLSASSAIAAPLDGALVNMVICKSPGKVAKEAAALKSTSASAGKAVRTLRVYETKASGEAGCLATYSKTNVEQTVGSSRQVRGCQSILDGIRKNLEASQWNCRQAGAALAVKSSLAAQSDSSVDQDDLEKALEEKAVVR